MTLSLCVVPGCRRSPAAPALESAAARTTVVDPAVAAAAPQFTRQPVRFTDISDAAGIRWRFTNGATGQHFFIETTGGGVAFLDYDRDGWLDLFAVQGGSVPGAPPAPAAGGGVLYRNAGDGRLEDVTAAAGIPVSLGYGQGVAAADFDNDGWTDLYVTAYGGNHLLRNTGKGRFEDVTARAGVADVGSEKPWPLSAAWGDYDRDGHLDLYVCHYVRWSPETNKPCTDPDGRLSYCRPQVYEGSRSRLYRNNGDGTFRDVSQASGISSVKGKSMSATWIDYDDDGWIDLWVTNDTTPNFLFRNNRDGTFKEVAFMAGVSVGAHGAPMSGMGIGVGDYDNDGRPDLFDVNFAGEPKGVWRNQGGGLFENRSFASNLASTNLQYLGFGLELCDYDLDGFRDLIVGNGHVLDNPSTLGEGTTVAQSQQLFRNQGDGKFAEDLRSLGDLVKPRITRGLAVGDWDNDGDIDLVAVSQDGPLQLFRNDGGNTHRWITFRLEGVRSNRDAIGAKITVKAGGRTLTGWVPGGSSYCSSSDLRVTFGLAESEKVDEVRVRWPNGASQRFGGLEAGRVYWIREGGAPQPDPRVQPSR